MMKTLVAVLCFALVATSVRGQDQESRLLTAIKAPQITEVALNTTVSNLGNITVAFKTGPNLPGTTFSVKCVAGTQGCNGLAAGDGEVTSPLPLKSSYVEAEVTNVLLGGNNTYQCFVSATVGKFSKCIEADPLPGSLTVFVRFLSYTPETFGAAEKAQLCKNFLALAPGTCDVVAVRPGSAIAETLLVYDSFFTSAEVYSELVSPSNATLEILGTGLGSAENIDGVEALPPSETVNDVVPSPPANVVATASDLCTPAIDVSWQAPGSGTIVTEYVITCVSSTSAPSSATVPGSATTASVAVLTGVEYQCSVFSNGPSGTSSSVAASPVAYEFPVNCLPGESTNVAVSPVSGEEFQRTISWTAPASSLEITNYNVICTSTFNSTDDVRKTETNGSTTSVIIGDGTGDNAPLAQGRTYSCSVAGQSAAGIAPAGESAVFGTVSFVTELGAKSMWWSGDTRLCPDTTQTSTCSDVQYLLGLTKTFPSANYPSGYTSEADVLIDTYNIKFANESGSTNGCVSLWGTNSNSGKSEILFVSLDAGNNVVPLKVADFLTSTDFTFSVRHFFKPDPTTRTPAFNFWVVTSAQQIYYFQPIYCSVSSDCQNVWVTTERDNTTKFRIFKGGEGWLCADGTTASACATSTSDTPAGWKANPDVGSVIFASDSVITGISINIGSYQRQAFAYFDWLETSVLNAGARVNFDSP